LALTRRTKKLLYDIVLDKLKIYGNLTAFEIMLYLKKDKRYTNFGFNAQRIGIACMELERSGKVKKIPDNSKEMTVWSLIYEVSEKQKEYLSKLPEVFVTCKR
jgi:hypothetical protein